MIIRFIRTYRMIVWDLNKRKWLGFQIILLMCIRVYLKENLNEKFLLIAFQEDINNYSLKRKIVRISQIYTLLIKICQWTQVNKI